MQPLSALEPAATSPLIGSNLPRPMGANGDLAI